MLERYRYTIAFAGLALLLLPRVPGIGQQVNGAYLGVKVGPVSFQPAELGKIALVIFLAAYLKDKRQVLVQSSRRFLGLTIPPLKHLGPLLVVWGAAMLMLDLHPRPRLVADVLRRVPGAALRGHEPAQLRRRRAGAVLRSARSSSATHVSARRGRASTSGCIRSRQRCTTSPVAPTRSPTGCSRRPTAGCSARAWARRCSTARAARR